MSAKIPLKKDKSRKSRRPITGSLFAQTLNISQADAIEMLRQMLRIRYLNDKTLELLAENHLPNEIWNCADREALIVGARALLRDNDYIICARGEYAYRLARNDDPQAIFAKLLGKTFANTPPTEEKVFEGDSAMAIGIALACKLNKRQQAAIYFCDDSEIAQSSFKESLNLAARSSLPLVIILEGAHAGSASTKSGRNILALAKDCGVEAINCDGMNILETRETVAMACEQSRGGKGPSLIGVSIIPHLASSDKEPVWKAKDPVLQYRLRLAEVSALSPAQAEKLDQVALKEIATAARLALKEVVSD